MIDLRLYLVTGPSPDLAATEAVVRAAVAGGVTALQLRDPGAPTRRLVDAARRLAGAGVPLVVNDRLDVAIAAGAAGVHLGQSDLHPLDARAIAGPGLTIGWSVTTPEQVDELAGWPAGTVDYLGVGPIHPTGSKDDAARPIGYAGIEEVRRHTPLPVVAIGGIGADHVGSCLAAGAQGVAVISAIWAAPDPTAAAEALRRALDAR
ncbi:thiamine phosphate synthase [Acidiferrimicrobium sp. IK]|uniref:thiamine phosphate synthase n=1 Tax=Acidiferrimicrobium sp. IK TaxID=2871700 RepID=UPI0021CB15B0|nr:thiamine phosphate synthase [Acidiferrimicrobium sp. IK]MCU4186297.1 thiamine phosphate synthase [Acidiferrimicrobium sp. IK]